MILAVSFGKVGVGILLVSLALIVLTIAYKKLLAYLGKGAPVKEDYCVLYSLDKEFASGEIEIYYTTSAAKKVQILLLNEDLTQNQIIDEVDLQEGGQISRFDTTKVPNGTYFYQLVTDNQKTMKKISIFN